RFPSLAFCHNSHVSLSTSDCWNISRFNVQTAQVLQKRFAGLVHDPPRGMQPRRPEAIVISKPVPLQRPCRVLHVFKTLAGPLQDYSAHFIELVAVANLNP